MFWIVLFVLALLAAFACGWMRAHRSDGRVIIYVETEKARQALQALCARGKELLQHVRH